MSYDVLVVGAGFAGAVMAERMASVGGKRVLVVDRREHVGGNAYDEIDAHGVLVHRYGFHTNSAEVFEYLSQFTEWRPYEHRVLASVDGMLLPIPINLDTVNRLYGLSLTSERLVDFFAERSLPIRDVRTSRDVVLKKVGLDLYEKFFEGYTRKQWGLDPSELDASVAGRIPVRTDHEGRYFTDTYQMMPVAGYTAMFERMLSHPRIECRLGIDYRDVIESEMVREMVYTGPVDEYFSYCFGRLPYRSLEFRFEHASTGLPIGTVNYPNEHEYTRVTDFRYLTGQHRADTTLCYEFPQAEGEPFYPIPRPENAKLYRRYQALAAMERHTHFVGRLATYRYYNMDQVVAQALTKFSSMARELTA
jgi:UDP-galactopyranose mutase